MKRLLILLLAIGSIAGTYFWLIRMRYTTGMRVNMERTAAEMAPEVKECRERLALFHTAWVHFRADHDGADPSSVGELFPKYLKSPTLLVCPTAKRLISQDLKVEQGRVRVGAAEVPLTYEFHWAYGEKSSDPAAPLVVCPVHHYVLSHFVFLKDPAVFTLAAPMEQRVEELGSVGRLLVVRRDGAIKLADTVKAP